MIGVASNLHNILLKINRRTFLPIDSGQNLTKLLQKIQGYHFFLDAMYLKPVAITPA